MSRRAASHRIAAVVSLALLSAPLLAACGQKGPLFLPPEDDERDQQQESRRPAPEPSRERT